MNGKPIITRTRYARRKDWRRRGFYACVVGFVVAIAGCGVESVAFDIGRGLLVGGSALALVGFVVRELNEEA